MIRNALTRHNHSNLCFTTIDSFRKPSWCCREIITVSTTWRATLDRFYREQRQRRIVLNFSFFAVLDWYLESDRERGFFAVRLSFSFSSGCRWDWFDRRAVVFLARYEQLNARGAGSYGLQGRRAGWFFYLFQFYLLLMLRRIIERLWQSNGFLSRALRRWTRYGWCCTSWRGDFRGHDLIEHLQLI